MSIYFTLSGYFESNSERVFGVLKVLLYSFVNELIESLNEHTYVIYHALNPSIEIQLCYVQQGLSG